jgi:hypothetical protein
MRELLRHAFRNTAGLINVSKLHRDFGSHGFSVSKNTLFEYLGYLEVRRTRKDLFYHINGGEVDLCDGEGNPRSFAGVAVYGFPLTMQGIFLTY